MEGHPAAVRWFFVVDGRSRNCKALGAFRRTNGEVRDLSSRGNHPPVILIPKYLFSQYFRATDGTWEPTCLARYHFGRREFLLSSDGAPPQRALIRLVRIHGLA